MTNPTKAERHWLESLSGVLGVVLGSGGLFLWFFTAVWWDSLVLPQLGTGMLLLCVCLACCSFSAWRFGSMLPATLGLLPGLVLIGFLWNREGIAAKPDVAWNAAVMVLVFVVVAMVGYAGALTRRNGDGTVWGRVGCEWLMIMCIWAMSLVSGNIFVWMLLAVPGVIVARLLPRLFQAFLLAPGRAPVDGWTILNSLCGYGSFILSCLTLPLFLPLAFILPGGRERWIASAMRRAMRFVFWVTPTITWRCIGELAVLDSARVVVSNHEGMLDILAACALPGTRTLLAKSWVFKAFPLGVAARAAGLRNSDRLLPEDYQEGVAATLPDPGVGIFVFPEGSRSRSGAIGRFRPGAFVLAKSLGCAVVPVAIAGSRLGIRPGSLWIHPSLVVSRVLPPMSLAPDETIRAFAARVRVAIVEARHRLLIDLLGTPRMALSRRHFFTGLGPAVRRAAAGEERMGAWRTVLAAATDDGDWLLIGCGWSTIPVTVRQLLPASRIIAWDPDAQHRAVARHAWFDPERDELADDAAALKLPERLAGVVCWQPDTEAGRALLAAAVCVAPRLVLVAGVRAPEPGFVPAACAVPGWSASVPGG